MTGGSSVAVYYPAPVARRGRVSAGNSSSPLPAVHGHAAVLAVQLRDRTWEQLEHFGCARPYCDRLRCGAQIPRTRREGARLAGERYRFGPIAITTAARPRIVAVIQARFGRRRAARMARALLGQIAVGCAISASAAS